MANPLANLTDEDRARNHALAGQSRRRFSEIKKAVRDRPKGIHEVAQSDDEAPSAVEQATYGVIGFPWIETEDGEFERINFRGGVGKALVVDFADGDETVELSVLVLDEDGNPTYETAEDGTETVVYETEEVDLNSAVAEVLLGLVYNEDGEVVDAKGGIRVGDYLALLPGVGPKRVEAILEEARIKPERYVRSLTDNQYASLLFALGVEEMASDEDGDEDGDDLDAEAEEFVEVVDDTEDGDDPEDETDEDGDPEESDETDEDGDVDEGDEDETDGDTDEGDADEE